MSKTSLLHVTNVFILLVLIGCSPTGDRSSRMISKTLTETPEANKTGTIQVNPTLLPTLISLPDIVAKPLSGRVVYSVLVSHDPFKTQIFSMNLDTGEHTQLTDVRSNDIPIWSPDGSQIVYTSWLDQKTTNLYLMNADGSNQRPIAAGEANQLMADWSPDGRKIVFVSNQDGHDNIYVVDLITQAIQQITKNAMGNYSPKWSPDGKQIAFISNIGLKGRSQIFMMNPDGSGIRQMTEYDRDNNEEDPVWCLTGDCIIFRRFQEKGPKLMRLSLTTKEVTSLQKGVPFLENSGQEMRLARSPARGLFTFSSEGKFYAMDLEKMQFYPIKLDETVIALSLYP